MYQPSYVLVFCLHSIPVSCKIPCMHRRGTSQDLDRADNNRSGGPLPSLAAYDAAPAEKLIKKHQQLDYPYSCTFGPVALTILDGVFCPTLTHVSRLLLEYVSFQAEELVLDMFAGSGVFGIIAALHGARAVTVDNAPVAVACARENAERNGVADRVEVREGDLWSGVQGAERFDVIVANPPLLPGEATAGLSAAIYDPGSRCTLDFIRGLHSHLKPGGRCYLVTSSVLERCGYDIDRLCTDHGLASLLAGKHDVGYETYRVHQIVVEHPASVS
jgi:methylase of polypeptide subunit release factors